MIETGKRPTPTILRLKFMYNAIREMVEDHFNKHPELRRYVVHEIVLSSTATYPPSPDKKPYSAHVSIARFICKITDMSDSRDITCIVSMRGAKFYVDNIYYSDNGQSWKS